MNGMKTYADLITGARRLPPEVLKDILDYKKSKLETIERIEQNRLQDIKHGRDTAFKYALPASILESLFGALITMLTQDLTFVLPVILLVLITYSLAYHLDLRKTSERLDIMYGTRQQLEDLRRQEEILVLSAAW